MSAAEAGGGSVEVVVKADEILGLLRERGEMSVAQIADGVGEPRSSVYRLIATLEDMRLVELAPRDSRYRLGMRLFELGQTVAGQLVIIAAARPAMTMLAERTGETVFLLVRDDHQAVCLERIEGVRVRSMAVAVGGTLPLHLGAGPLVLLAHAPAAFADEYLGGELTGPTEHSVVDPEAIRDRLAQIREQGYVVSDEDLLHGMAAVGAPVRDADGSVVAALSLSGIRESMLGPGADERVRQVREAATEIVAPSE